MSDNKPTVLTPYDWQMIQDLDKSVSEAIAEGDFDRAMMLYSKIRYPMCSLVEFEQKRRKAMPQ